MVLQADNEVTNAKRTHTAAAPCARQVSADRGCRLTERLRVLRWAARPRERAGLSWLQSRSAVDPLQLPPMRWARLCIVARGRGVRTVSARTAGVRRSRRSFSLPLPDRCSDQGVQVSAQAALCAGLLVATRRRRRPATGWRRWDAAGTVALAPAGSARLQPGAGAVQAAAARARCLHHRKGQPVSRYFISVRPRCGGAAAKPARGIPGPWPNFSASRAARGRCPDHGCDVRTVGAVAARGRRQAGQRAGTCSGSYAGLKE